MDSAQVYQELPSSDSPNNPGNNRTSYWKWILLVILLLVCVLLLGFFFWPRDPELEITEVEFKGLSLNTSNGLQLDINLELLIQVSNPNYFGVDYDRVTVHIFYRGNELGRVNSSGGHISARDSTNLSADLDLQSLSILKNAPQLISDFSQDRVPVSTSTHFFGNLNIIGVVKPQLKVTVSCELLLDPGNSTILSKECDQHVISEKNDLAGHMISEKNDLRQHLGAVSDLSLEFWLIVGASGLLVLVLLIGLAWFLWPKAPEITVDSVDLQGFTYDSGFGENYIPEVTLDINLGLHLKVRNRNFFGASYEKITVVVYYSGYEVCKGEVGQSGEIPARDTTHVDATLDLKGAEIVYNTTQLLGDISKRELVMNMNILFIGGVGIWFFKPHIKGAVAYDIKLDPVSNEILEQDYHIK